MILTITIWSMNYSLRSASHTVRAAGVREHEHYSLDVLSSRLLFCFLIKKMGEEQCIHLLLFLGNTQLFSPAVFVFHKIGCWHGG